MNFLAHAILSHDAPDSVVVGNLTADFIKGRIRHALPVGIRQGFALHHRIDLVTDTHPAVAAAAELIAPQWGRYSTVLIDVYFDHLLAANFGAYHSMPLAAFTAQLYATLRAHHHLLPDRAQLATAYMIRQDWLTSYATHAGIELAFARMSRRLKHGIDLAPAIDDLARHHTAIAAHFTLFWPDLHRAAHTYRRELWIDEPPRHQDTKEKLK